MKEQEKNIKEIKSKNLNLWNSVSITNPAWTKPVNNGTRKYLAVNPQKVWKVATSMFGHYGSTWGLKNIERSWIDIDTTKILFLSAVFYFPKGEFEISNSIRFSYITSKGKRVIDDEAPKKIETNTVSKALSKLGFCSDLYEGEFNEKGYEKTASYAVEDDVSQAKIKSSIKALKICDTLKNIDLVWNRIEDCHNIKEVVETYKEQRTILEQLKQD